MPAQGIPVIVLAAGGVPVTQVTENGVAATVATNGQGLPITLVTNGAPMIIDGPTTPVNPSFPTGP